MRHLLREMGTSVSLRIPFDRARMRYVPIIAHPGVIFFFGCSAKLNGFTSLSSIDTFIHAHIVTAIYISSILDHIIMHTYMIALLCGFTFV